MPRDMPVTGRWQVWACTDSTEGGIIVAAELDEPSGFWHPIDLERAVSDFCGEGRRPHVRLYDPAPPIPKSLFEGT